MGMGKKKIKKGKKGKNKRACRNTEGDKHNENRFTLPQIMPLGSHILRKIAGSRTAAAGGGCGGAGGAQPGGQQVLSPARAAPHLQRLLSGSQGHECPGGEPGSPWAGVPPPMEIAGDPELLALSGKRPAIRGPRQKVSCAQTASPRGLSTALLRAGCHRARGAAGTGRGSPAKAWCELCLRGIVAHHVLQKMGGGEERNDAQIPSPTPLCSWVTNHLPCINHLFLLVSRGKISLMLLQLPPFPPPPPLPSLQIYFLAQSVSSNHN